MGLAPYGAPKYAPLITEHLIQIAPDFSFRLNMDYFDFASDTTMVGKKFFRLFDGPPRKSGEEITQRHMDLAASIQKVAEDLVLGIVSNIAKETGQKNLCLAGGVALNSVINGLIAKKGLFESIWIHAGGALGAAFIDNTRDRLPRSGKNKDAMRGALLGREAERGS